MHLLNGGAGKESHDVFSTLLCYGAHGSGGIIKSSKSQRNPLILL